MTSIFIEKAKLKHDDRYDYSLVNYINSYTKVIIICKEHGEFTQSPNKHLAGRNCPMCYNDRRKYATRLTKEQFIDKAKEIHDDKYIYNLVEYGGMHSKIKIICKTHGEFIQKANDHINGHGCDKCFKDSLKCNLEKFIIKAKEVHGNKYDYSSTIYNDYKEKLNIRCELHGEFFQTPNQHLSKHGCPKCCHLNRRLRLIKKISDNKYNGLPVFPAFNKNGCELLDNIAAEKKINIKHAMNGGEYFVKELGYWLDGYDEINNIVYEIDEKHHFKNGVLRDKDVERQKEIMNYLKCEFIRINI